MTERVVRDRVGASYAEFWSHVIRLDFLLTTKRCQGRVLGKG